MIQNAAETSPLRPHHYARACSGLQHQAAAALPQCQQMHPGGAPGKPEGSGQEQEGEQQCKHDERN